MALLLALHAAACAPSHEWGDNGPCPTGSDRFEPDLEPDQRFVPDEETLNQQPCSGGHRFRDTPPDDGSNVWTVAMCTPDWCVDGYEGLYCFTNEAFTEWFASCDTCERLENQRAGDDVGPSLRTQDVQCDGRTSSVPSDFLQ